MKKIILVFVLFCLSSVASAQWVAPGLVSNANVGGFGLGRTDAQIEFRNDGGIGHSMISGMQMVYPGAIDREVAFNAQAYTANGANQQMGSMSYVWIDAGASTFNSVWRLEVSQGQVPIRCYGRGRGCVLFGPNGAAADHDPATGPLLRIDRSSGYASIAGKSDLYMLGKDGGSGPIGLNVDVDGSGNSGPVQIGGQLQFFPGSAIGGCPGTVPAGVVECLTVLRYPGPVTRYITLY